MAVIVDLFEGFLTWQTPVSFLAGVGVYHLYCKLPKGKDDTDSVQET